MTPDEDVASLTPSDEQQMTASYSDRALDREESQRDRTALYSLDEIEKAATANEEASAQSGDAQAEVERSQSSDGVVDDSTTGEDERPDASESLDTSGDESIDEDSSGSSVSEDGSMSSQAQQSIEDGSVPSAEVDDVDTSNVDKDAPVWLGTDDGFPQLVASTDTVPISGELESPTNVDFGNDDKALLPSTLGSEVSETTEAVEPSAVYEPTMDLEPVSVDTPDEPSYGIENRPTEPSSTVALRRHHSYYQKRHRARRKRVHRRVCPLCSLQWWASFLYCLS